MTFFPAKYQARISNMWKPLPFLQKCFWCLRTLNSLKLEIDSYSFGQLIDHVINCKEPHNEKWFEPHNKVMVSVSINVISIFRWGVTIIVSACRWGNWGSKSLRSLPKFTHYIVSKRECEFKQSLALYYVL